MKVQHSYVKQPTFTIILSQSTSQLHSTSCLMNPINIDISVCFGRLILGSSCDGRLGKSEIDENCNLFSWIERSVIMRSEGPTIISSGVFYGQ